MTARIKRKEAMLGVVPIGKFVFSHEDAVKQKKKIFKKLDDWRVKYTDIEEVLPDGMVRDQKHVDMVAEDMKKKKVDALFIPHCNFGTEGAELAARGYQLHAVLTLPHLLDHYEQTGQVDAALIAQAREFLGV